MSKVAVVKGGDRKDNILRALKLVESEINQGVVKRNKDVLFIKVNGIDLSRPLSSTHPDALETVVSFFDSKFKRIIVGDNTASFANGAEMYANVKELYPKVEFTDLRSYRSKDITFKDVNGKGVAVKLSALPEDAYTVSLALPKTHDAVAFTGCCKNMLGCGIANRHMVHGTNPWNRTINQRSARSNRATHENMIELVSRCRPDLAVLDAFVGMEGNGPLLGTPIEAGLAMCSTDAVCLDLFASRLFGFGKVWYLEACAGSGSREANVLNSGFKNIEEIRKQFRLHRNYRYMQMDEKLEKGLLSIDFTFLWFLVSRPRKALKKLAELVRGR